ncbi:methionine ABC transporter ATP-binding protein [Caldibacillus lycopersici]|uniref:Methionine ABC transporter ATP-binding protein n=1 Tax=Perspicuibacillus lycopersici TaxID=1325689 RepID=A0AAE3ISI7_9BACI|nr:methionine ABC transporter ATP-binding protein [Perspicuibacillus lycopersici]MCU9613412.1 methionine ABC transporter ATP-binding protein [Perspicuibacillus lycopersici]
MISIHNVSKSYHQQNIAYQAISNVTLNVNKGEIHGIIGASGAGKSTLLRLMNLLEVPDAGEVLINNQELTKLRGRSLRKARQTIGMIFQHFNLVANKTVYNNVLVSLELANYPKKDRRARVTECLKFVGLETHADKYPAQLSGGQKQRVAIARALANQPEVLLCDEPTSALDPNTTAEILEVLQTINQQLGVTIVIVSHEMEVIKSICNRVSVMEKGQIFDTVNIMPKGFTTPDKNPQWFVDQLTKAGDLHHA